MPDVLLNALSRENLTIRPAPDSSDATSSRTIDGLDGLNGKIAFTKTGTYSLSWVTTPVPMLGILSASQAGKLIISSNAQQCVVAVQVPTPSVSVPGAGPVNSIVNGIAGGAVSGVNNALAPVNSAVGPVLGTVNGAVGSATGGGASGGGQSGTSGGSTLGTIYKPSSLTPAQQRVPQGGDSGGGGGGASSYGGSDGASVNAPDISFKGIGSAKPAEQVKSGGSPKTVDLAANKPQSALGGWANLIVLAAVLALSGATAFYARTYLLHPLPATVRPQV
ncbi:MAG TPA: hypothetical protein VHO01_15920 [Jatrophihabitans sp.]|nr:hypothetical protein [Jatrophihabitans sp.]